MSEPNICLKASALELAACTVFAFMYAGSLVPLALLADAVRDDSGGTVVLNAIPFVSLVVVIATLFALLSVDRIRDSECAAAASAAHPAPEETPDPACVGTFRIFLASARRLLRTFTNTETAMQLLVFYAFAMLNVLSTAFLSSTAGDGYQRTGFPLVYNYGGGFAGISVCVPLRMSVDLLFGVWISRLIGLWLVRRID